MKTENTLTLTVKRTFAPISSETEKELDRLCELYGQTLQRFQQSFCSRELWYRVWDWRDFRNEIVRALALSDPNFSELIKTLRSKKRTSEAELLTYLRLRRSSQRAHLQARHWKLCLEEAASGLRTYWKTIKAAVRNQWRRFFGRYSDDPSALAYIHWLLREEEPQFYEVICGKIPYPGRPKLRAKETEDSEKYQRRLTAYEKLLASLAGVERFALAKRVEHAIQKVRRKIRLPKGRLTTNRADFDCSCWRVNSKNASELKLMSFAEDSKPRKPFTLTLKGAGLLRGTIQLIKSRGRYELRVCHEVKCEAPRTEGEILGLDMGYTEVAALSSGAFVGTQFGARLTRYSDYWKAKGQKRNQLRAKAKKLSVSSKAAERRKALNIFTHNLGRKKANAQYRRAQESIKQEVNRAINDIVRGRGEKVKGIQVKELVIEKLSAHMKARFGKNWNRRLSGWARGYVRERLEQKTQQYGITLTEVNACQSSRVCPSCSYAAKENRMSTDRFKCQKCGYEGQADTCAALEILRRRSGEIPLDAAPRKVLEIIKKRYERGLEMRKQDRFPARLEEP